MILRTDMLPAIAVLLLAATATSDTQAGPSSNGAAARSLPAPAALPSAAPATVLSPATACSPTLEVVMERSDIQKALEAAETALASTDPPEINRTPEESDPITRDIVDAMRAYEREVTTRPAIATALHAARTAFDRDDLPTATRNVACVSVVLLSAYDELDRLQALVNSRVLSLYSERNLRAAAAANGIDVPLDDEIRVRLGLIRARTTAGQFDELLKRDLQQLADELVVAHKKARDSAVERRSAIPPESLPTVARTKPCPPAASPKTLEQDVEPKIDVEHSVPSDSFFPEDARREQLEGVVALRVDVSPTGCPRSAQVVVKGPDPRLDDAAVRWMLEGAAFHPAVEGGKAAAASKMMGVRFTLYD